MRKSNRALHKAAHIVTAYSSDLGLILGQTVTDEKSNEIEAIPRLLETLDIKGSTVTIDAMGTQVDIAEKIIKREGDYILALKGNQDSLYEDAQLLFESDYLPRPRKEVEYASCVEKAHGRIDKRECWLMK